MSHIVIASYGPVVVACWVIVLGAPVAYGACFLCKRLAKVIRGASPSPAHPAAMALSPEPDEFDPEEWEKRYAALNAFPAPRRGEQ